MTRRLNTSYPEAFIRRIERRLMNILEYYNRGAYAKYPNMSYPTSANTAYRPFSRLYKYKTLNSVLEVPDLAFQRVNDVHKVETETLLGYKMMALNVKSLENQRFMALMDRVIVERLDKDKLISKKVKLGALGYTEF
ncbi:hypothetical protein Tco_0971489 [Tanacetum coccineum]